MTKQTISTGNINPIIRTDTFDLSYAKLRDNHPELIKLVNDKKTTVSGKSKKLLMGLNQLYNLGLEEKLSIKNLVIVFLISHFKDIGLSDEKIKKFIKEISTKIVSYGDAELAGKDRLFLDFYILQALSGKDVNVYILGDSIDILTIDEFLLNKLFGLYDYINISLNYILYQIYKNKKILEFNETLLNVSDDKINVVEKLLGDDWGKVYKDISDLIDKVDTFDLTILAKNKKPIKGKAEFKEKKMKRMEELRKFAGSRGYVVPTGEERQGKQLEGKKKYYRKEKGRNNKKTLIKKKK